MNIRYGEFWICGLMAMYGTWKYQEKKIDGKSKRKEKANKGKQNYLLVEL